jgi:hypothetical protein
MHVVFWFGNLKRRDHSDLGVGGRIILKCILGKQGGKMRNGCIWLRIGPVAGLYENGNELLGFMKSRKFLF